MMLNNNIGLQISHQLQETSKSISRSLERLSTGKRVNSPKDDVAAYSTLQTLSSQIRGLSQANLNVNHVRGLIQTADAAISTQLDIVQRMRELAVQASSDSLGSSERDAIGQEVSALMDEFRRITSETEFNGTKLLDGSFGSKDFMIGANAGDNMSLEISSLQASSAFEKTVGLGTFKTASTFAVGDGPADVILADLNGDGHLDMASVDSGATDTISVYINKGDGTFGARTTVATSSSPAQLRAGDVNGDGIQDLVVSNGNAGVFDVIIGNGDGSFQTRVTYSATGTEFVLADLNNDDAMEIIFATSSASVGVLMNNGDGTFQDQVTTSAGTSSNQIHAADFDNDGNMDVVITTAATGTSQVLRGDGSGNLNALSTFATGGTSANSTIGDFNNDGYMDLLVAYGSAATVAVRLGVGDGTFSSASNFTAAGSLLEMAVGDFNNDGKLDFIGRDASGYYLNLGNGQGGFSQSTTGAISATAAGLQVGDLNGDGVSDFVVATSAATDVLNVFIQNVKTQTAEADITVSTAAKAQKLIGILDDTIERLTEERVSLSTNLSRLDSVESYNLLQSESLSEAKGLIEDADIAYETSELVRNQILQQAQIAALSQANINMQVILGLFQY